MRYAWKSDRGLVRENNEDSVYVDEANGLFLLADGMGGGPGGEVASALAVTAAHHSLMRDLRGNEKGDLRRILAGALAEAHSVVAKRALQDSSLTGMGTTLEIVLVRGSEAAICHVGDSRVYLFRRGALGQITDDDNYAAVLTAKGVSADEIPSGYRHVLTQVVGLSDELVPEIPSIGLAPGDLLLICSDGLAEALGDAEVAALMGQHGSDLDALAEALIAAANRKGGPDNVSVVVIEPIAASADPILLPLTAREG